MYKTNGIHHITAITADPQKNLDFYEGFLGQRLVKKTVNFDDPRAYHLYYGDSIGNPGTIITFFYWPHMPRGESGVGEVASLAYRIHSKSYDFWIGRIKEYAIEYREVDTPFGNKALEMSDPDGLTIHLVVDDSEENIQPWESEIVPAEHALRGFYSATLNVRDYTSIEQTLVAGLGYVRKKENDAYQKYESIHQPGKYLLVRLCPDMPQARQGSGSIHHIAFQAENDDTLGTLKEQINVLDIATTGLIDRQYFHSNYFMTPADILFEIATNDIGFTVDEPAQKLGESLKLPPQFETHRQAIEENIQKLELPRNQ